MTDATETGGPRHPGAEGSVLIRLLRPFGLFNAGETTSMSKERALPLIGDGFAEFVNEAEAVASLPTAANVETMRAAVTRLREQGRDPDPNQPKDPDEYEARLQDLSYGALKRKLKAFEVDIGPNPKKSLCIEALVALRFAGIPEDVDPDTEDPSKEDSADEEEEDPEGDPEGDPEEAGEEGLSEPSEPDAGA